LLSKLWSILYCTVYKKQYIACYSLGNQAIKEHSAEKLNKIVSVYHMLEPDNPYVFTSLPSFMHGKETMKKQFLY